MPSRADHASAAFARLVGPPASGFREPGPADLLGLEHEFVVRSADSVVDFRTLVRRLPLGGMRLDPGDVNAHRCAWGGVVTADGREAEVAIPPVSGRPGFTGRLERNADQATRALRGALPVGMDLEGYSTHLSVSMPSRLNAAASQLFMATFAPGLMLLTDRAASPGLLVRPRPGRMELATEYVDGSQLRAAVAYVAGAAAAIAGALQGGTGATGLPPALDLTAVATADRYGWGLAPDAFGPDILRDGRNARLSPRAGGTVTAQEHLQAAWAAARAALGRRAAPADLEAADREVEGLAPIPIEAPSGRATDAGGAVGAVGAVGSRLDGLSRQLQTSPFGDLLVPRYRRPFNVAAELATWDVTVFAIAGHWRRAYASIPRVSLRRFLSSLDRGELDEVIEAYLEAPATGRLLAARDQAAEPGLYDAIATPAAVLTPEPVVSGPVSSASDRPGKAVGIVETGTGGRTWTIPWLPLGGGALLVVLLLVVGLAASGGGSIAVTPSLSPIETAPGAVATPPVAVTSATPATVASPTPGPVGLAWTGATVDLTFRDLTFGRCATSMRAGVPPTFGGGWAMSMAPGAGANVALNMLALPTSPFAPALNGSIAPSGALVVSGDSAIEAMNLTLQVPSVPAGPLAAPLTVTGSAQVALHTTTGDCQTGWTVSGTLAPPGATAVPSTPPAATAATPFTLGLALNYGHSGATSSVCLTVQSNPAQAGAAVTATIAGPGIVGPSQISSTLLADGSRHGHFSIDLYGRYVVTTTVTSQGATRRASQAIDVSAAPGQGTCP